ncbi:hypothetical protein P4237_29445 [Pseudomonas aeruginosa]|nr:hypothetical protein [Pseudomonas aeruginosa]
MHPPKLGQEIATTGDGRDITRPFLSGLQQPSDYILQRRGGNDLRIYEEVLRDAQVKATWGQRQLAVVSKEWQVDAGGDRRIDKAAAEHLKQQLQNVGWDRITNGMLYGVYYGHAVSELIYGRDDQLHHPAGRQGAQPPPLPLRPAGWPALADAEQHV